MNTLVLQFIAEARDYLDEAARGLLALEQSAHDASLINSIFRNFHTIKGTSGIFPEFAPITRLTHGAEDLMDQVRNGQRELDTGSVDLLLGVLDQVGAWLACIEDHEELPPGAEQEGSALRERLQQLLQPADEAPATAETTSSEPPDEAFIELQDWARSVTQDWPTEMLTLETPAVAFWYRPEESCFFLGDDPVNLLRQLPEPMLLELLLPDTVPPLEELDPFTCVVSFRGVVVESVERIRSIFQYIPDQISLVPITPALLLEKSVAEPVVPELLEPLWTAAPASQQQQPPDEPKAAAQDQKKGAATSFIRVDQRLVNQFMDLVGELLVARNALPYLCQRAETVYRVPQLAAELDGKADTISQIVSSLQDVALEMRMLPVAKAFERFPRLVRDISNKLGKKVNLVMEGEETRADKDVIEALSEPLIHMVRNSLDHGVEQPAERTAAGKQPEGTIHLRAFQETGSIVVEIVDDGKGIDPARIRAKAAEKGVATPETLAAMSDDEVIQLIFAPNFSTADQISDLSGRGVGMDAVQTMVTTFNGTVRVSSLLGKGSTVRLTLPLSMAITRLLTVKECGCTFGIPANDLLETLGDLPLSSITTLGTAPGLRVRGELLPLYSLGRQLAIPQSHAWFPERFSAVVVKVRGETVALAVDEFCDIIDAVMKPLAGMLAKNSFYGGSTILGDGSIMLLLNLPQVIDYAAET
ncbi:MAG: chemotaxis protein CheA [Geobacter sp.]|nr:chemotaxis protein CheA [Geobacter sp.]